jgi:hypothetical protein
MQTMQHCRCENGAPQTGLEYSCMVLKRLDRVQYLCLEFSQFSFGHLQITSVYILSNGASWKTTAAFVHPHRHAIASHLANHSSKLLICPFGSSFFEWTQDLTKCSVQPLYQIPLHLIVLHSARRLKSNMVLPKDEIS